MRVRMWPIVSHAVTTALVAGTIMTILAVINHAWPAATALAFLTGGLSSFVLHDTARAAGAWSAAIKSADHASRD